MTANRLTSLVGLCCGGALETSAHDANGAMTSGAFIGFVFGGAALLAMTGS